MAFKRNYRPDTWLLFRVIELLKLYHDIGICETVLRTTAQITGEHWYEFAELGLECVAPVTWEDELFYVDQTQSWVTAQELDQLCLESDNYPTRLIYFTSPEMQEYTHLCRLYERREGIRPEDNPFEHRVRRHAQLHCGYVINAWLGFSDDVIALVTEISPEDYFDPVELITNIYNILMFYPDHLWELRLAILSGLVSFDLALPAPKGVD